MPVFCAISFDNIKPVHNLCYIIRVFVFVVQEKFFKFSVLFVFKTRRIETDLTSVFQQFNK